MKWCPDCEREQNRLYEAQLADIAWHERRRKREKEDEIMKQQEAINKMQKAVDYYNIRKSMSFIQKFKELFK